MRGGFGPLVEKEARGSRRLDVAEIVGVLLQQRPCLPSVRDIVYLRSPRASLQAEIHWYLLLAVQLSAFVCVGTVSTRRVDQMSYIGDFGVIQTRQRYWFNQTPDTQHHFSSLTWHDIEEFSRFLHEPRPLIFHLHGIASRFGTVVHTLDEYRALEGSRGLQALEFLGRIIERETLVFIGYGLADREIEFVATKYHQLWNRWPDWYLLAPNPTPEAIHEATRRARKRSMSSSGHPTTLTF